MSELFLNLLNRSIAAGWLVAAIVVLRPLLRRAPRRVHCVLWGLVGLRLVWPFSIPSPLSLLPSAETVPPEILYDISPTIHTGVPVVNATVNPFLTEYMTPNPGDSVNPLQVYTAIASFLWLLGLAALLIYTLISYLRLRRAVANAVPLGEGVWYCAAIDTPFLLGIFHPRIYLPFAADDPRCEAVLAHERAHLRHRDHLWKPLGWLLLCLFWFHPLLWLAWVLLGRDMELRCDEAVIGSMDTAGKKAYSHALLSCSAPRSAVCPLAFGEVGVKQRIRAVLHYRKPAAWLVLLSCVAAVVLAVCFLTDPPASGAADPTLPSVSWTCSPAVSAIWGSAFFFDFGELEYTHIKATCDTGELWDFSQSGESVSTTPARSVTLDSGLALCWSPYTGADSFRNPPTDANVEVAVYNGMLKLYSGTIRIVRTAQTDSLSTTYTAWLDGDLRLLTNRDQPGARVVTARMYSEAVSAESILYAGVDLDHDGRSENIHVHAREDDNFFDLLVVENGSLLWSTSAHTSHPGWTTLALVRRDGKDYLMEYNPYMTLGYAYYSSTVFSLEGGYKNAVWSDGIEYIWPTEISDKMAAFAANVEEVLQQATVLLSTEQGDVVLGPVAATEVPSIWPVTFDPAAKG